MTIAPIVHELTLRCSPAHAFASYVDRIGAWWDPAYTRDAATLTGVFIEPDVGGRVYARHRDGDDDWGTVRSYEPSTRVVYSTGLAQPPDQPASEITVTFAPAGDGCAVRFEHGGWTDGNAGSRAKFGDWPALLARYAAFADG